MSNSVIKLFGSVRALSAVLKKCLPFTQSQEELVSPQELNKLLCSMGSD